ncbi:hypothetical protein AS9A_1794 [Hoyosella subflava DQS3-9A1]|uniref:Uncharacterized protein n=1 Tax=Hoyosella subflava (strain DSM 45089 / JCM 17490 / NBRC 109087 / DQS3-9A1) TaxID=443218 RepID=F6ELJ3_HOYSD|nr:hypothetical protein AS9A_1794 [Hoyosella subflava DQS3-9A1]
MLKGARASGRLRPGYPTPGVADFSSAVARSWMMAPQVWHSQVR